MQIHFSQPGPSARIVCATLCLMWGATHAGEGLRLAGSGTEPDLRWQSRLQGLHLPVGSGTWPATSVSLGARGLPAHWLGDYYLNANGQGLRLSGGLVAAPADLSEGPLASTWRFGLAAPKAYIGLGYGSTGPGWGVSADVGFTLKGPGLNLRDPSSFAQSLDLAIRGVQLTPMVQMGLFYRF